METDQTTADQVYSTDDPIVEIRDAAVTYDDGESYVLDHVSIDLDRGEILGVVGESGSGKSMLASSLLDAVPSPGRLMGKITYRPDGDEPVDVLDLEKDELRSLRWEEISMVFQGAMNSFNPTMPIRTHFEETLKAHDADVPEGIDRAEELLEDLHLEPERILDSYPHELSGGMQQRALIALSLVLEPDVLVMDEPTAALDLLMQRSILMLLSDLQEKYNLTMVFITHDLPLVAALADRMAIMYAFRLIEIGETRDIVENAAHPYTRALLNSTPNLNAPLSEMRPIEGQSPAPINMPSGCAYHPRCPLASEECRTDVPDYHDVAPDHGSACYHWRESYDEVPLVYEDSLGGTAGGESR
ncbi:oligopeptide/dipeptide ABC transporter, ATPase subunit (plasmid) [Haloterrigena turkmenica DSM 5511]|uniref:Oligopeptide/dipeptide ABC transporter, ATPase subunit n=1 Tax=Haloterrigena turkmenica (strain ATCC 51198 / DSM 5511 / JCM 9101 / NCIMB 13204 / VKM B-1734 / 4k) TaxID=543526 RepID=D2S250_HALTV|nr:ABC transporter ATP-binding protein [Haloterrigena turkmenica]ADB63447.1 oligopeptide/dipeptide ABC transporter, ATPase subunit [Haloterrigena turkmenica DSM 5511]